jgi:hypothetical protein
MTSIENQQVHAWIIFNLVLEKKELTKIPMINRVNREVVKKKLHGMKI